MRLILIILLLLSAVNLHAQVTYTSIYTESFPTIFTNKVELINRSITFSPNSVSITTELDKGKEIEILTIEEINSVNGSLIVTCKTKKNDRVTITLPDREPVKAIDYFAFNPKTREEFQLRFYIQGYQRASVGY